MADAEGNGVRGEVASLTLSPRQTLGKKTSQLRRRGQVPVHLYGGEKESLALQTTYAELRRLLPRIGRNIPVSISIDGSDSEDICFVREVQRDPVTDEVIHVDFLRTDVRRRVRADVPVILEGTAPAVSLMGGTLIQNMLTVSVEALPLDMPPALHVDVRPLVDFDTTIHVSDIAIGEGLSVVSTGDDLVARVAAPRVEVEAAGAALDEEGEAPSDGEAPGTEAADPSEQA